MKELTRTGDVEGAANGKTEVIPKCVSFGAEGIDAERGARVTVFLPGARLLGQVAKVGAAFVHDLPNLNALLRIQSQIIVKGVDVPFRPLLAVARFGIGAQVGLLHVEYQSPRQDAEREHGQNKELSLD